MSNKITTNEIPTPATVFVTGLLTYSRLKEQIAGDKLTADKETRKKKNLPIINEPYTTATIRQPQILFENPNGATDENARTIAEKYAIQSMYKGQSGSGEWQFSMTNKGKFLPKIYVRNKDNPTELIPFTLEGELAKDVRVTLIVKIYKATPNNGVTLAGVIIESDVQYYSTEEAVLESRGWTVKHDTTATTTAMPTVPTAPAAPAAPAETINFNPPVVPTAPATPSYPAAPAQAYSAAPAATTPYPTAPAAPAAPAVQTAPVAPAVPAQPGATSPYSVGIEYNPATDPARNYRQ